MPASIVLPREAQIVVHPTTVIKVRQLSIGTQHFHGDLRVPLIQLAPIQFLNRTLGTGSGLVQIAERPRRVQAKHLEIDESLRQAWRSTGSSITGALVRRTLRACSMMASRLRLKTT